MLHIINHYNFKTWWINYYELNFLICEWASSLFHYFNCKLDGDISPNLTYRSPFDLEYSLWRIFSRSLNLQVPLPPSIPCYGPQEARLCGHKNSLSCPLLLFVFGQWKPAARNCGRAQRRAYLSLSALSLGRCIVSGCVPILMATAFAYSYT